MKKVGGIWFWRLGPLGQAPKLAESAHVALEVAVGFVVGAGVLAGAVGLLLLPWLR